MYDHGCCDHVYGISTKCSSNIQRQSWINKKSDRSYVCFCVDVRKFFCVYVNTGNGQRGRNGYTESTGSVDLEETMLSVNMNQDVEKYQESVAAGLNAQQTIAAILALAVSTCVICILYFGFDLPLVIDVYIAIPVCIPIILPALGRQYGLSVTDRIKQSNKRKRVILFYSWKEETIKKRNEKTPEKKRRGTDDKKQDKKDEKNNKTVRSIFKSKK